MTTSANAELVTTAIGRPGMLLTLIVLWPTALIVGLWAWDMWLEHAGSRCP